MNWIDEGYLISKSKYNENSIVAEFYTKNRGKCSGIIFGSTSKKNRSYLQIGNKLHLNYNYKNESKIGSFKVEIIKVITPLYFDNKKKLLCISSAMSLVKLLTVEFQENKKIFDDIENLFINLDSTLWLKKYIFWELNLLKYLGYDLSLKNIVTSEIRNNKKKYFVKSNSTIKHVPSFLVEKNNDNTDYETLISGLKIVTDYLDKSILKENNVSQPLPRLNFINTLR